MKWLLLVVLLLAAIAIGYPLLNEDAGNECSALERRLITALSERNHDPATVLFLQALQSSFSNGAVVRSMVKRRSPDMPAGIACGIAYWRILFDPDQAEAMLNELLATRHAAAPRRAPTPAPAGAPG